MVNVFWPLFNRSFNFVFLLTSQVDALWSWLIDCKIGLASLLLVSFELIIFWELLWGHPFGPRKWKKALLCSHRRTFLLRTGEEELWAIKSDFDDRIRIFSILRGEKRKLWKIKNNKKQDTHRNVDPRLSFAFTKNIRNTCHWIEVQWLRKCLWKLKGLVCDTFER